MVKSLQLLQLHDYEVKLHFFILPTRNGKTPYFKLSKNQLKADPTFYKPSDIDILIAAEFFYNLIKYCLGGLQLIY